MSKRVLYMVWAQVAKDIEDDWNQWMEEVHIPHVTQADGFISARKYKIQRDAVGLSFNYVSIYEIESMEAFEHYRISDFADQMRQEVGDRYADKVISARTVLEEAH